MSEGGACCHHRPDIQDQLRTGHCQLCSLPIQFRNEARKTYFSMQESLVKEEEPLHEDLPEHNGAAQRDARVQPIKESIP